MLIYAVQACPAHHEANPFKILLYTKTFTIKNPHLKNHELGALASPKEFKPN